jgi:aryl-alcohol dehydrogenase-like predicted oxidoreductase
MLSNQRFGDTGFNVSIVGLGAGQIGQSDVPESVASDVLNGALDLGVMFDWHRSEQEPRTAMGCT